MKKDVFSLDKKGAPLRGKVVGFSAERGGGTIETDDGRTWPFDVSVCSHRDPRLGEPVRARVGPSRFGRERVTFVEIERTRPDPADDLQVEPPARGARAESAGPDALVEAVDDPRLDAVVAELRRARAQNDEVRATLYEFIRRLQRCESAGDYREVAFDIARYYESLKRE